DESGFVLYKYPGGNERKLGKENLFFDNVWEKLRFQLKEKEEEGIEQEEKEQSQV
ncbi:hypothetical protein A2U01_0088843, partial [Trifolium medium]|nr:hypothetical protein [Trifolium medium]